MTVTLQAVERAMSGSGRARIHNSQILALGIAESEKIEVLTSAGTCLTLIAFADSHVSSDQIQISADDLKKLGIPEGGQVTVRRKIPVSEQIKTTSNQIAHQIGKGLTDLGETMSGKSTDLIGETKQITQDIQDKTRIISEKIVHEVTPISDKITDVGRETAAKMSATVEAALKRLKPGDVGELKTILLKHEGNVRAVIVTVPTVDERTIRNLTLPPEVIIAAVQRADNTLVIPNSETVIQAGDVVYLIGKDQGLEYMAKLLEG